MKNVRITKKQFALIEAGETVELTIGGFPAYASLDQCGEFVTPNGYLFEINFYAPNAYTLLVNGESQVSERDLAQMLQDMKRRGVIA